jgi:rhamnose transport system permease protein
VVDAPSPPAEAGAGDTAHRSPLHALVRWETVLVLLLGTTIFYGWQVSSAFMRSDTVFYVGLNVGEVAIMALPLALIVITGEIDLSVAATLGLAGVVMAELFKHGWPIWPAMAAALVLGAVCGAFNGFLVTRLGLPSLAVTIGTLTLFRGIAQVILPTDTIGGFPTSLTNIGVLPIPGTQIPWSILFFAILALIVGVVLHATPLGRAIFAIGASQEAAFFAGIRVKRIKFWLFVVSGLLSGFAGILWTLRFSSARYDSGTGLELYVVTIVLLGGVSIFGGRGTIVGVVLAVCILSCLQTAMTLALVSSQNQNIVIGGLLIASVIVPSAPDLYRRGRLRLRTAAARRHRGERLPAETA